jgi:hypothetical protein
MATSSPSDQRLTTVVPLATTPESCSGQRRNDQRAVIRALASAGASALTWRFAA